MAIYDTASGRIFRFENEGIQFDSDRLRHVAGTGKDFSDPESHLLIVPIRENAGFTGSIGVAGDGVSQPLLETSAQIAGAAFARHRASRMEMRLG